MNEKRFTVLIVYEDGRMYVAPTRTSRVDALRNLQMTKIIFPTLSLHLVEDISDES